MRSNTASLRTCALSIVLVLFVSPVRAQSSSSSSGSSSADATSRDTTSSASSTTTSPSGTSTPRTSGQSEYTPGRSSDTERDSSQSSSREYGTIRDSSRSDQSSTSSRAQPSSSPQSSAARSGEASEQDLRVERQRLKDDVTDANKASKIIGMEVKNMQNEDLGKVSELVIDTDSGKVAYAVISSGGILGMGDRLIAVPFESLTLREGQKAFVIDANKERLTQASGFSDENWPSLDSVKQSTVGLSPTGRSSADIEQERRQTNQQQSRPYRSETTPERDRQSTPGSTSP